MSKGKYQPNHVHYGLLMTLKLTKTIIPEINYTLPHTVYMCMYYVHSFLRFRTFVAIS